MSKKEKYFFWILGLMICVLSMVVLALKAKINNCESQNKVQMIKEDVLTKRILELGNILRVRKNDSLVFFSIKESNLNLSFITNSSPKLVLVIV